MIVVMKSHCNEEDIEHVLTFLDNHGLSGHPSRGVERTVIGVLGGVGLSGTPGSIGGINPAIGEALECLPNVELVLRVSKPYKLASREFHPEDTVVDVPAACVSGGSVGIGGAEVSDDGRSMHRRKRETVAHYGSGGAKSRSDDFARRSIQTIHIAIRISGHGRRRFEIAGESTLRIRFGGDY